MSTAPTHGAMLTGNGMTHFRLWAPDAQQVTIELTDGKTHPLEAESSGDRRGWFSVQLPCPAGTAYRFIIDNQHRVPDPAARAQLDDVHSFSYVVDPRFPWRHDDWRGRPWHESIIYEVHVGLLGGFKGVQTHLPRLRDLGVTAIELMPLGEFPGARNWGYDGVLPFAPDASYGTPDELKALIDEAHGLGLMIYVDVVYNHFGPDGNYLGQYASGFFRDDIHTPWGSAIDFRRREVRDFFIENALMWLVDYRVDGLRFDAVHAISDKSFLAELAQRTRAAVPVDRHVHLVLENEDNAALLLENGFDAQWNDDGHNVLHTLLTGERESYYADFADDATDKLALCLREGFIFQGEKSRHGSPRGQPSAHLPATSFVLFLQNHDQVGNRALGERLLSLTDPDALRAATVLLLLSPMIPLLFMGEEIGSTQPFFYFTDHNPELAKLVNEGRQREFSEFSAYAAGQEFPLPNDQSTFERSRPFAEDGADPEWVALYRELLQLRHQHIIPRLARVSSGGVDILGHGAVSARWRLADECVLRIDINLSDAPAQTGEFGNPQILFNHRVDSSAGMLPPRSAIAMLSRRDAGATENSAGHS